MLQTKRLELSIDRSSFHAQIFQRRKKKPNNLGVGLFLCQMKIWPFSLSFQTQHLCIVLLSSNAHFYDFQFRFKKLNSFSLFHLPILGTRNALKQCVHESRSATPQTQPTRFQLLEKRIERFPDHPHLNRWLRAGNFFGKPNEQKVVSWKTPLFLYLFFL